MNTKIYKTVRLLTVGVTLLLTAGHAKSWYICSSHQWDGVLPQCGQYLVPISPNAYVTENVRWSYDACTNFEARNIEHEWDVQGFSGAAECEVSKSTFKPRPKSKVK